MHSTTVAAPLLAMCKQVPTPLSATVKSLVETERWDDLAKLRVSPEHYHESESYWADAQLADLFRKYQPLPTSIDREAVAKANFWHSEHKCCRTNLRLIPFLKPDTYPGVGHGEDVVRRILVRTRKIIRRILGRAPHKRDDFDGYTGAFGPGATYGDKGRLTTVPDKMMSHPTLTPSAIPLLFEWSETAWARACVQQKRRPLFVPGNRFTTVPKDCEKDRGIAIEPSLNVFYQLGLGLQLKKRLKRAGLDLRIAQDIHRQVACVASLTGCFATIDLSNASDTVAKVLVKLLLPHDWFEILSSLRSPKTLIDNKWVLLEKFSSMGNGFTFELETLIFAALSKAAVEEGNSEVGPSRPVVLGRDVYVFGDDIIVPTESVKNVVSVLRYFGFEPNPRKTFVDGSFRESCGGDFFRGEAVRPYFQKDDLSEPQHFIAFANGLRRSAKGYPHRWRVVREAWFWALSQLPASVRRLRGPEGLGDLVIHDEPEKWTVRLGNPEGKTAADRNNGIRYIRAYMPLSASWVAWQHFTPDAQLATALYGVGDGYRGVLPRDAVTGYVEAWVPFS